MFLLLSLFLIGSVVSDCPSGSEYISQLDTCLAVVKGGAKNGFYQALVDCRARGGDLTSIESGFANMLYAYATKANIATGAYIGANVQNEKWTWVDGKNMTYQNWAAGQPSDRFDCAMLNMADGRWSSADCGQRNASYFCTLPSKGTTPSNKSTRTTPETQTLACAPGWTLFENNCYFFNDTYPGNVQWKTASAMCRNNGAELASIHTQGENDFLLDFVKSNKSTNCFASFIGLQRNRTTFSWSDGTVVDYNNAINSAGSIPSVYAVNPLCTKNGPGWWTECSLDSCFAFSFVCKKPATPAVAVVNVPRIFERRIKI